MKLILAIASLAAAAPIVDLSGTPPKDMVTKRQVSGFGTTPLQGTAQPGSGPTGNLNNIIQGIALGGPNGAINQNGGIGSILSGGNQNLANLPDPISTNGGLNTNLNGGITNSDLPPQVAGQIPGQGNNNNNNQQNEQGINNNGAFSNGGFSNALGGINTQGGTNEFGITGDVLP